MKWQTLFSVEQNFRLARSLQYGNSILCNIFLVVVYRGLHTTLFCIENKKNLNVNI